VDSKGSTRLHEPRDRMTSSSFVGMNGTSVGGGAGRSVAWKPASTVRASLCLCPATAL
jgi:hypothetical protein